MKFTVAVVAALLASTASAQTGSLNAICSTDQSWCEMAAKEFTKATGITVNQTRKATGEALAQIRAEAANPKTDIWWGGTGDRSRPKWPGALSWRGWRATWRLLAGCG